MRKTDKTEKQPEKLPDPAAEMTPEVELHDESPLVADALAGDPPLPAGAPPRHRRFSVVRGGRISNRGFVVNLRPGKVVREVDYNLDQLRAQGIELKELED